MSGGDVCYEYNYAPLIKRKETRPNIKRVPSRRSGLWQDKDRGLCKIRVGSKQLRIILDDPKTDEDGLLFPLQITNLLVLFSLTSLTSTIASIGLLQFVLPTQPKT